MRLPMSLAPGKRKVQFPSRVYRSILRRGRGAVCRGLTSLDLSNEPVGNIVWTFKQVDAVTVIACQLSAQFTDRGATQPAADGGPERFGDDTHAVLPQLRRDYIRVV